MHSHFTGVTILLSLTVFLNMVAETMPATSDAVPLLGKLFASILSMSVLDSCVPSGMNDFIYRCLLSRGIYLNPPWNNKSIRLWITTFSDHGSRGLLRVSTGKRKKLSAKLAFRFRNRDAGGLLMFCDTLDMTWLGVILLCVLNLHTRSMVSADTFTQLFHGVTLHVNGICTEKYMHTLP